MKLLLWITIAQSVCANLIFKETVGNVSISTKKVEIWVKLNLEDLREILEKLYTFRTHIKIFCNRKSMFTDANGNDCEHFLKTSSDMLAILNENLKN